MFRYLNQIEKKIIKNSLLTNSSNLVSNFTELENNLCINIKKRTMPNIFPKIYLLSDELKNLLKKLTDTESISLGGLYFGFIKRGKFYLSLEGAEFLYKKGLISDLKQLYVNKRGEKSVLYGNNILKHMLIKKSYDFGEKDFMLVFNEKNEIIAISRATVESDQVQNLRAEDLIAINLSDKGIYLREKQ
jgi:ribosome biogenesis protein Nip4